MKKLLYIMRGVPGSGKSTKAKQLAPRENIFSTDDFWGADYNFDVTKLGAAHRWNQGRVRNAMLQGMSPVVVDNTNVMKKDFQPYIDMAHEYGYDIETKESDHPTWKIVTSLLHDKEGHSDDLDSAAKFFTNNNIHKVPEVVIRNMLARWEVL
jgi:predicted kinase